MIILKIDRPVITDELDEIYAANGVDGDDSYGDVDFKDIDPDQLATPGYVCSNVLPYHNIQISKLLQQQSPRIITSRHILKNLD